MKYIPQAQYNDDTATEVIHDSIAGYTLRRALSSPRLVDVVAMNAKGEMLTVVESDMEFDVGSACIEALNKDIGEL